MSSNEACADMNEQTCLVSEIGCIFKDLRYFVNEGGVIYSIFPDGRTNYNSQGEIRVENDTVYIEVNGEVVDECAIWHSLTNLAKAIES